MLGGGIYVSRYCINFFHRFYTEPLQQTHTEYSKFYYATSRPETRLSLETLFLNLSK